MKPKLNEHKPNCVSGKGEWSGSCNPAHPDTEWICDECGAVIKAEVPAAQPTRKEKK